MSAVNQDYLWIGLGIGALYLIYKATNDITKVTGSIADTTDNLLDSIDGGVDNFSSALGYISKPFTLDTPANNFPLVKEYLFKSPLVTVPQTVKAVSNFLSKNSNNQSSSKVNSSAIASSVNVAKVFPSGVANSSALNYVLGKTNTPFPTSTNKPNVLAKSVVFK